MTWHTVLSGKEECRKNGAWDLTICQSKERALDQAHALLRYGYIVYAIQAGGKTIMDEEQIRKVFPLTQSNSPLPILEKPTSFASFAAGIRNSGV